MVGSPLTGSKRLPCLYGTYIYTPLKFSVQSDRVAPGHTINRFNTGLMNDLLLFCTLFCTILLLVIETRLTAIF